MTPQMHSNDEISLLDILVVLAENFWLLVLGPLAFGAITFGVLSFQPKTYQSEAILQPPYENESVGAAATMAARLNSAEVQMRAAEGHSWIEQQFSVPVKKQALPKSWTTVMHSRDSNLITIKAYGPSPMEARSLAEGLITSYLQTVSLRGPERTLIEQQMQSNRESIAFLTAAIKSIVDTDDETGEIAFGKDMQAAEQSALVDLVAERREQEIKLAKLTKYLDLTAQDIVIQAPTINEITVNPSRLQICAIAIILSYLALTVLVLIRAALRGLSSNPEGANKVARIRRSILRR